jgi:hypothetical protein
LRGRRRAKLRPWSARTTQRRCNECRAAPWKVSFPRWWVQVPSHRRPRRLADGMEGLLATHTADWNAFFVSLQHVGVRQSPSRRGERGIARLLSAAKEEVFGTEASLARPMPRAGKQTTPSTGPAEAARMGRMARMGSCPVPRRCLLVHSPTPGDEGRDGDRRGVVGSKKAPKTFRLGRAKVAGQLSRLLLFLEKALCGVFWEGRGRAQAPCRWVNLEIKKRWCALKPVTHAGPWKRRACAGARAKAWRSRLSVALCAASIQIPRVILA